MSEHFHCCPSIYESIPYSSLTHRNAHLSNLSPSTSNTSRTLIASPNDAARFSLGPPDLVHVVKCNDAGDKCLYSYHYVIGADTSTSASIAVYINSLINDAVKNKSTKSKWKVTRVLYCSWDPFTSSDVRVEARIPGGIRAFLYTSKGGETTAITEEQWMGVQVAGVLRCAEYGKRGERGLRMVEMNVREELIRMNASSDALVMGSKEWQGTEAQGVDNCMTDALLEHCTLQQLTQLTTNNLLIAKALIKADKVKQAMHLLCDEVAGLRGGEILAAHLTAQLQLLPSNIELAQCAVRNAPFQPLTWIHLSRAFMLNRQFEQVLIALNSCPAFALITDTDDIGIALTGHVYVNAKEERDLVLDASSPLQHLLKASFILKNDKVRMIYAMLVEMVNGLGWDAFLGVRDAIFFTVKDKPESTAPVMKGEKTMCEAWLEQLLQLLYTDLKAHTVYHSELDISITNSILVKKTDAEWNVLGDLCCRMGDWSGARDAWNRIVLRGGGSNQQDGDNASALHFNDKVTIKLAEVYKEGGQLGHLLIAIDKLIQYYNEIGSAYPHCVREWIGDVKRRFGEDALMDAMHVLSSSISEVGRTQIQGLISIEEQ